MAEPAHRSFRWDIEGRKYTIELMDAEKALLDGIDLRMGHPSHAEGYRAYKANRAPILELMSALLKRGAIPEQRWKYWADPEYSVGRSVKTSPRGVFGKNGSPGEKAYVRPHFIPYLRYFLFGAYLPDAVIGRFEREVDDLAPITSGDIVPLMDLARTLTRKHGLDRDGAALEFYKLCLDIEELDQWDARSVRNAVMKIPRSKSGSNW